MTKGVKKGKTSGSSRHVVEDKIVENLIALQKTNLQTAEKFEKLSEQINGLLRLFEAAARSFAANPINQISEKDKEFLEKIDKLLEQNKTIARGLSLMEERMRERVYGYHRPSEAVHLTKVEQQNLPEHKTQ